MKILWSDKATDSLISMMSGIEMAGFSKQKSLECGIQVVEKCKQLIDRYSIYPYAKELKDRKYRVMTVHRRCKVYYYVHDEWIEISLVWPTRRNPRLLKRILK